MHIRKPAYYDAFHCTASACRDTCCAGWEIDIDPASRDLYRRMPGPLGEKLRTYMEPGEESCSFRLIEGERCPFLTEKNLCELILEKGDGILCEICREHPRFHEWFGSLRESGLGLCCEEAARLVLGAEQPTVFVEENLPGAEEAEDIPKEERPLLSALFISRETAFTLLRERSLSLGQRCSLLLAFGAELQEALEEGNSSSILCLSEFYAREGASLLPGLQKTPDAGNAPSPRETTQKLLSFFAGLEPMDPNWPHRLLSLRGTLPKYCSESGMGSPPAAEHTEGPCGGSLCENFLIYFVYRYWMKSFYDGELLPKAKLAVTGFLLFRLLNGTEPSFEGAVQNAKAFSKEVEYSDENLDAFYTAAWQEDFLNLPALFTLLLSGI